MLLSMSAVCDSWLLLISFVATVVALVTLLPPIQWGHPDRLKMMHGYHEHLQYFDFGHAFPMHKGTSSTSTHETVFSVW